MDKYIDLINYLKRETRDDFYLTLKEMEEISGVDLPKSAYEYSAYWSTSGTHYLANQIWNCGFKVKPDLVNKRIRLIRIGQAVDNAESITFRESKKEIRQTPVRKGRKREDVPNPTVDEVEYWLKKWDSLDDYVAQENAIDKLFYGEFSSNDNLQNILIKCSVLNDFYSTNIFKIYPVAKHILSLDIDERLRSGDPTLVDDIARIKIGGKEMNFYSFASKYCSHHNQLEYPIYDSYVHKVLKYFRSVDNFCSFDEADLKVYPKYKNILIQFRKFYKLDKYNLKELDKFLWQFGKKYFPKNY